MQKSFLGTQLQPARFASTSENLLPSSLAPMIFSLELLSRGVDGRQAREALNKEDVVVGSRLKLPF